MVFVDWSEGRGDRFIFLNFRSFPYLLFKYVDRKGIGNKNEVGTDFDYLKTDNTGLWSSRIKCTR